MMMQVRRKEVVLENAFTQKMDATDFLKMGAQLLFSSNAGNAPLFSASDPASRVEGRPRFSRA